MLVYTKAKQTLPFIKHKKLLESAELINIKVYRHKQQQQQQQKQVTDFRSKM